MFYNKRILTYTSLLLTGIILILVNILGDIFLKNLRFDFTEQKIYTLSKGSKTILADINEPITIRCYFSKKLAQAYPYLISYASRVRELLAQYQRASNGKIIVNFIEVESFTETEDQAVNYGLQGIPADGNGNEFYFGLVATNALTNKEVIPFLQATREAYLEYDISQMLYKLIYPQAIKIGLLTDIPLTNNMAEYFKQTQAVSYPWVILEQLKETFDIQMITATTKKIAADIKVLMLVATGAMSKDIASMVDQFVTRGGHVLAFIDPRAMQDNIVTKDNTTDKQTNYLRNLLQAWGVTIPSKIFVCPKLAKKVKYQQDSKEYITNYPIWLDISKEYFAKNEVLTSNLTQVTLATTGIIENNNATNIKVRPLISSDGDNMLITVDELNQSVDDPSRFVKNYVADKQHYDLAVRISGVIPSAFNQQVNNAHTNIILLASTEMLRDNFWVKIQNFLHTRLYIPISGNGSLVLNAVENLTGSDALISIRNRGVFARPFTIIQKLQTKSKIKFKAKEDALMRDLEVTKEKLLAIQQKQQESNSIALRVEKKHEEEIYRKKLVVIRKELRAVQRALNKGVEQLEIIVKIVNIVLLPLLVFFLGCIYWLYRIRKSNSKIKYFASIWQDN